MSSGPQNPHQQPPEPSPFPSGGQQQPNPAWTPQPPPAAGNPGHTAASQQRPDNAHPPTVGYAVGSMFGHIWKAITAPVDGTPRHHPNPGQPTPPPPPPPADIPLHRTVQEQQTVSSDGRVILRRTTIEEVELRPTAEPMPTQGMPFVHQPTAPAPNPPPHVQ